jgi:uncharacterized protein (TIGR01777 family)
MKVAITGSHGLIGSALTKYLTENGNSVTPILRSRHDELPWFDPDLEDGSLKPLEGYDAIVHLAGYPIGQARFSVEIKTKIYASRVYGTRALVDAMSKMNQPPKVFISASAIGYYGDRGDETLNDNSPAGSGFLSRVTKDWEAEALKAKDIVERTCLLRTGIVLASNGGILPRLVIPFKIGLGATIGNGHQWMSWITLDDEVAAISHLLFSESLAGPINLTAPNPVTNSEFTRVLAERLHRPAFLSIPTYLLHLALGREMADELLLASQRVVPAALLSNGFQFKHQNLSQALESISI